MKKNFIFISLLLVITLLCSACSIVQPTVLTIDGEEISLSEYNYYFSIAKLQAEQTVAADQIDMYWQTEKDGKTTFEILKDSAFDEMVALRVTAKKAEQMGISYNDNDVRQNISGFKSQILQAAASESQFYEMTNTDSKAISEIAKLYAIRSVMLSKLADEGKIDLSDAALTDYFKNNFYKANHILVLTQDATTGAALTDEQKAEKKKQAEEILQRAQKGENFDNLVKELSEDPGKESNPNGYVFTSGEMVPEFEEAVKNLQMNQISGIVETSYGYHIIKRLPLTAQDEVAGLETYKDYIQSELMMNYINTNVAEWKKEFTIVENKEPINKIKL